MHPQVEQSTRSTNRSFKRLIKVNNVAPEVIYKAMCEQTVELVFTAHPTQACTPHIPMSNGFINSAFSAEAHAFQGTVNRTSTQQSGSKGSEEQIKLTRSCCPNRRCGSRC